MRGQPGEYLFIGSPQVFVPKSERAAAEAAIEAAGISCVLVHLEPNVASRFYQGFCKSTLWPLLHNVLDVYNTSAMGAIIDRDGTEASTTPAPIGALKQRSSSKWGSALVADSSGNKPWQSPRTWNPIEGQEETWSDYCEVNRTIAKAVIENYQDDDLIWVQHYHLLLLPSYLARKLRYASIGMRRSQRLVATAAAAAASPCCCFRGRLSLSRQRSRQRSRTVVRPPYIMAVLGTGRWCRSLPRAPPNLPRSVGWLRLVRAPRGDALLTAPTAPAHRGDAPTPPDPRASLVGAHPLPMGR